MMCIGRREGWEAFKNRSINTSADEYEIKNSILSITYDSSDDVTLVGIRPCF